MRPNKGKYVLKQYLKMIIQGLFLPGVYRFYRRIPVTPRRMVFADAHHDSVPFSMQKMHQAAEQAGFEVIDFFYDYGNMGMKAQLFSMIRFMKLYASAQYVFLCDYFLPAASCHKKKETFVIQLWHSGGLLKTMGFAAPEDIPPFYKLNPHGNYDLVTVSAPCCIPVFAKSMHLPQSVIRATGISRSDVYFDNGFIESCKKDFYKQFPNAKTKKVVLWAPTFRGTAASPHLAGTEDILRLQEELGDDWLVLIKVHPYLDRKVRISNCEISTEKLLSVADLLITDYSSVLFDYLLFEKPFVLFAPDYTTFQKARGFYLDYSSLPGPVVTNGEKLAEAVQNTMENPPWEELRKGRKFHMGCCDGQTTQRILSHIQKISEKRSMSC